jgi:hypothetical protein
MKEIFTKDEVIRIVADFYRSCEAWKFLNFTQSLDEAVEAVRNHINFEPT